jgi:hypothetical protein
VERLQNLHPDLQCWGNDILYRAHGEFLLTLRDRLEVDLRRMHAAIHHAGLTVARYPPKTNSQGNVWTRCRDEIAVALRVHSTPKTSVKSAKALAIELMDLCGLRSPRKPRRER